MQIDKDGLKLSKAEEIFQIWEKRLQKKFGADFYIKPEGVIDNIAFSFIWMEMSLQEQIAFLAKQFDPETAEGKWQDALYQRIGIKRMAAQTTLFTKKIKGVPGYKGAPNTIFIHSTLSGYEFSNTKEYLIEDDGTAKVQFECILAGMVEVNAGETFTIVEAPNEVTEITSEDAADIAIGRDRESDKDFRTRFRNSKSQNAKATYNANMANLLKYVDDIAYLQMYDKKKDNTMEAGTIRIIAKHNTTDEIFAQAIMDTVALGPELLGDTTVIVKDASGEDVPISWKNADEIPVEITGKIKIRTGYYPNTVMSNVKQKIMEYIEKRIYGLASKIYATEFIVPMLETDGVEAVTEVEVKRTTDAEYSENISMTREQVPVFALERITLTQDN